jgi:hypothetical protein
MRLFRRKKNEDTSPSGEDASQHQGRESAYPIVERAKMSETLSRDGPLGPRMADGLGVPLLGGHSEHDVPDAVDEIRAAANPEDDNARETLIRKEREAEERGL